MATTDLNICISALLLIGADEITSFDDSSREARICSQIYEVTKQNLLQSHNWTFSLAYTELSRTTLATTSSEYEHGWIYEYTLPPDYLRMIRKDNLANDYKIVGDKLYSNDNEVHVLYQYDVSESEFPSYFTRALEMEMAKLLASALLQDDTAIDIFSKLALRELIRAKGVDSQNSPSAEIPDNNFALISVRSTGV